MTETFYDVLGVPEDASSDEIESAYREAVKEVHPDVSDAAGASQRTKRLNKAKRVLTDDAERQRYDRIGHDAYTNGGPGGSATSGTESSDPSSGSAARSSADSAADGAGGTTTGSTGSGSSTGRSTGTADRRSSGSAGSTSTDGPGGYGSSRRRGRTNTDRRSGGPQSGDRRSSERRAGGRWSGDARSSGEASRGRERGRSRRGTEGDDSAAEHARARATASATGPSWQTGPDSGNSRSARRQAAGRADGMHDDWSWNSWNPTDAWAVRQSGDGRRGLHPARLFPSDQSVVLLGSTFFCYPFFVGAILFPPFPLAVRAVVAVCTLLMFAYLLSIPEVAIVVFGLWSVLAPLALLLLPGVGLFSLAGVVGLVSTWVPLGLSVLTYTVVRP